MTRRESERSVSRAESGSPSASIGRVMEMSEFDRVADRFEMSLRIAQAMAAASLLPEHLRTRRVKGPKGVTFEALSRDEIASNCVLLVNQAMRWGVDPFSLPGESYVVGGKLAFQGKLVAAIVNKRAGLKGNLKYEFTGSGMDLTVVVSGCFTNEHEPRTVDLRLGDAKTDNEMWKKDPYQKLIYSGSIRWARRHCPEVLLGVVAEGESDTEFEFMDAAPAASGPAIGYADEEGGRGEELAGPATDVGRAVSFNELVADYRDGVDEATSQRGLEIVVDEVKTDSVLTEPAKQDLIARAKSRWAQLPATEEAAETS